MQTSHFSGPTSRRTLGTVLTLEEQSCAHSHEGQPARRRFTGASESMPSGRVFGGQVLAQACVAASLTAPSDRILHSIHGSFLRPGDTEHPVRYAVESLYEGTSFSRLRVDAMQSDRPIFSMVASFQRIEDSPITHRRGFPAGIPSPTEVPSQLGAAIADPESNPFLDSHRSFDVRRFQLPPADDGSPRHGSWMRATTPQPEHPAFHRAALAYASDYAVMTPALERHNVSHPDTRLQLASLDHAMWWHGDLRVDEWFLYVLESPTTGGGRGLSQGSIFTANGVHSATVTQEGLLRWAP